LKENHAPLAEQRLNECKAELRDWEWHYLQAQCHPVLFSFPGNGAAFSPDGVHLASWVDGKALQVYDVRTGREILTVELTGRVHSLVYSPDGTRIATRGDSEVVRLYDARTGRELFTVKGSDGLQGPVFSPDGRRLLTWGRRDGVVRVFDARVGRQVTVLKGPGLLQEPAFSPDGTRVATGSLGDMVVRVYDTEKGSEEFVLKGTVGLRTPTYSPDGLRILAVGSNSSVRVYDARTRQEALALRVSGVFEGAAFSPDGTRILCWDVGGSVRVYDVRTGREVIVLKGPAPLREPSLSPDGTHVAVWGGGAVRVYDARTGRELFALRGTAPMQKTDMPREPSYSPDGTRLAVTGVDGVVRVYDARAGQEALAFKGPHLLQQLVFSKDGTRIAARGNEDEAGQVYDARTGRKLFALGGAARYKLLVYSPDGSRLLSWDHGGTTRVYDARTGQEAFTVEGVHGLEEPVFNRDGTRLALLRREAGSDVVHVYDTGTGRVLSKLNGQSRYDGLAISPDGTHIAGGDEDEPVKVYDVLTGRPTVTLNESRGFFNRPLVYSPDGTLLAAGGSDEDRAVQVYDAKTGRRLFILKGQAAVREPAFSPDGTRLAVECGGALLVHDARTGRELFTLKGPARLQEFMFNQAATRLAAGDGDGAVRVYDARTGHEVITLQGLVQFWSPVYSPDGTRLAVQDSEGIIRIWVAPRNVSDWQAERRQALVDGTPAWHRTRAVECEQEGDRFAAAFHWGRLALIEPGSGEPHYRRGLVWAHLGRTDEAKVEFETALTLKKGLGDLDQAAAHAELGQWDAVRTLYARAVEGPSASSRELTAQAMQRLHRGDPIGYSAACAALLKRFGEVNDPTAANNIAWVCALGPKALPDLMPAVALARRAVHSRPKDANFRNTLGTILFRAGQYEESVRALSESIQIQGKGGTTVDYLFLAMAHHKLNQPVEARTWLEKGMRVNPSEKTLPENERLELQLLRREAEALLNGPAPQKK
jgi:WD40 repeat protein/Flp pilus assembly protein TadD